MVFRVLCGRNNHFDGGVHFASVGGLGLNCGLRQSVLSTRSP